MNDTNNQILTENLLKRKEMRYMSIIEWLENMTPFDDVENIPSVPKMRNEEDYKKYVVKNFIRCGAIPKSQLEVGKTYLGDCRNASKATWNGKVFTYQRTKFSFTYNEEINHFEDDNGFDLFVPLKKLKNNYEKFC